MPTQALYTFNLWLCAGLLIMSCSNSNFSGTEKKTADKQAATRSEGDAKDGGNNTPSNGNPNAGEEGSPGGDTSRLIVPVDKTKAIPSLDDFEGIDGNGADAVKSCQIDNEEIATIDSKTCRITGKKVGTTAVTIKKDDGTQETVIIDVVDDSAGDGRLDTDSDDADKDTSGEPELSDGNVTKLRGHLCLGGPACNIAILMGTEEDAERCQEIANSQPCSNDSKCGPNTRLQVCNCECESSTSLPIQTPDNCTRFNPLKPGAPPFVAECRKI